MAPEASRKRGLSQKTLETIAKFLPKNNPAKPDGFPVSFSEFCALTNVRKITVEAIKCSQKKSYEIYLENEDCILAQEYNFYLNFYKSNEKRSSAPISKIQVVHDCPEELRKLVLSFPKKNETTKIFPVPFKSFRNFTNCDEIVNKTLTVRGRPCEQTSTEWQALARRLYRDFYTSKEARKRYKIQIKPCTKTLKSKLLKFAEDIEQTTKEENFVPQSPKCTSDSNDLAQIDEPSPKRPRYSLQVDDSSNSYNEKQFPVSFDTFLMHTNIKTLVERFLENSSKTSPNSVDVIELAKKLYVEFYTKPRYETELLNELFVRHNYADIITAMSEVQLSTDSKNEKRVQNVAEKEKVVIQSVQIFKPAIQPKNNKVPENALETATNIARICQKDHQITPFHTNEVLDRASNCFEEENDASQVVQTVSEITQPQFVKMPDKDPTVQIAQEIVQNCQPQLIEISDSEQNQIANQRDTSQGVQKGPTKRRLIQSIEVVDKEQPGQIAQNESQITKIQTIEIPDTASSQITSPKRTDQAVRELDLISRPQNASTVSKVQNQKQPENRRETAQIVVSVAKDPQHGMPKTCDKERCEPSTIMSEPSNSRSEISWHYPVSFEFFYKNAYLENVVLDILKQRKAQGNTEEKTDSLKIAQEVYENFYKFHEKRNEYALRFKPLPKHVRLKLFEFAFKTDNTAPGNCEKSLVRENVSISSCETVVSSTGQLEQILRGEERSKNINETDKTIRDNNEENTTNSSGEIDSVERDLMNMFGGSTSESQSSVLITESNIQDNTTTIQNYLSTQESDVISSGESINLHQNVANDNLTHNATPTPDFTQLQSRSLLQTFHTTSTSELEQPDSQNFIEMPNTQLQCDALLNNIETTSNPDPLNETLVENKINETQTEKQRQSPPGTLTKEGHTHKKENTACTKIKKESEKFVPLDGLIFELNETDNEFEVTPFAQSPILLNDTQNIDLDYIAADFGDQLKTLTDRMEPSTQECDNSRQVESSEESFVCAEAQRLPSSINESTQESQNVVVQSLPPEVVVRNSQNKELSRKENVSQRKTITYESTRKKPAVYRVALSKNLQYQVPQILHGFRALQLEGLAGQKNK